MNVQNYSRSKPGRYLVLTDYSKFSYFQKKCLFSLRDLDTLSLDLHQQPQSNSQLSMGDSLAIENQENKETSPKRTRQLSFCV